MIHTNKLTFLQRKMLYDLSSTVFTIGAVRVNCEHIDRFKWISDIIIFCWENACSFCIGKIYSHFCLKNVNICHILQCNFNYIIANKLISFESLSQVVEIFCVHVRSPKVQDVSFFAQIH